MKTTNKQWLLLSAEDKLAALKAAAGRSEQQ